MIDGVLNIPLTATVILIFILIFPLPGTIVFGADISVTAVGTGADTKAALLDAKRSAVEKGIGSIIAARSEANNFMLTKEVVVSKTIGAVRNVQILQEEQTADGLKKLTIAAIVSRQQINEDLHALGILMESMDKPRILVLVAEKMAGRRSRVCETAIAAQLRRKNFNLVDPAVTATLLNKASGLMQSQAPGVSDTLAQMAASHGAEVLIVGKVALSQGETVYDLHSAQADISLQVILCSDGRIISSKNLHGASAHLSKETAMVNAVQKAAADIFSNRRQGTPIASLFDDVIVAWQEAQNNGSTIRFIIGNVTAFATCTAIKRAVSALDHRIVGVIQRGWRDLRCELDLRYKGGTETLAERIDGREICPKGTLSITEVVSGRIIAEIRGE